MPVQGMVRASEADVGKLRQSLGNDLALDGGRDLQFLAQQHKLAFRVEHAQVLKERGRLAGDGFEYLAAGAGEVVRGRAAVEIEQPQQLR